MVSNHFSVMKIRPSDAIFSPEISDRQLDAGSYSRNIFAHYFMILTISTFLKSTSNPNEARNFIRVGRLFNLVDTVIFRYHSAMKNHAVSRDNIRIKQELDLRKFDLREIYSIALRKMIRYIRP